MGQRHDYDVIVLGGGSAGSAAASAAVAAGARTLMINSGELGGLCILRGCMPTKAMLASAHAIHEARHTEPFGIRLDGSLTAEFHKIMQRKEALVQRFKKAKVDSIEAHDYEVLDAFARFAADGSIDADGRRLTAERYVVATGSTPVASTIAGHENVPVLDSDGVMRLERQPKALLVHGAGPIGLELAQFFARIGTRVLLVNRSPLLYRYDAECGEELHAALEAEGIELIAPGTIERLEPCGDGLRAHISSRDGARAVEADVLLNALGRNAALGGLGLEHVGLDATGGRLSVDATMATSNPRIYAAGDATGSFQILHIANQEGAVAGYNACGASPAKTIDYRLKMAVTFTDPPFATVGATEDEARKDGDVLVGHARFPETGRAITMETRHGLWKLFADRRTGEILGSAILGPRADDLIHTIAALMHYRADFHEIFRMPWYHPTLSEVMLNLARDLRSQAGERPTALEEGCDERPM
ncbi:MAG: FAD-dependent oxidoreductase [bacterium]|nr:FAD-dependent oxidoreductase [bacterium]